MRVADAAGKGRGVFATEAFGHGALVHEAHVILLEDGEVGPTLDLYVYRFGRRAALAFGLGSLFNHSRSPSLDFVRDFEARTIRYYAARSIRPGEELTIEYSYDPPGYVDNTGGA
jgi:SET domain-containing protein